ncbi:MAG TPA: hypothetical protein VGJ92_13655 [Methanocella sp.]|jgi:uncharacterized membrane protein
MEKNMSNNNKGNVKAALAYVLGFFTAIPILLTAGEDRNVRFHAWQSIIWSFVIAGIVTQALGLITPDVRLIWLLVIIACLLYGAATVATGREFRMPLIAGFVEKQLVR